MVSYEIFQLYATYKAFDYLSEGAYKKLVVKSKENGDPWAVKLYSGMQEVANHCKRTVNLISSLHEYGKNRLQMVCNEVISSANPPCRKKQGWNVCMITGVRSDDCIDLTKHGKGENCFIVNGKFSHFVLMLWLVVKIEHVCKIVAKNWLQCMGKDYSAVTSVNQICEDFAAEDVKLHALHMAFNHALTHVMTSIETYKKSPEFGKLLIPVIPSMSTATSTGFALDTMESVPKTKKQRRK